MSGLDLGRMYFEIELRLDRSLSSIDEYERKALSAAARVKAAFESANQVTANGGSGAVGAFNSGPNFQGSSNGNFSFKGGFGDNLSSKIETSINEAKAAVDAMDVAVESAGRRAVQRIQRMTQAVSGARHEYRTREDLPGPIREGYDLDSELSRSREGGESDFLRGQQNDLRNLFRSQADLGSELDSSRIVGNRQDQQNLINQFHAQADLGSELDASRFAGNREEQQRLINDAHAQADLGNLLGSTSSLANRQAQQDARRELMQDVRAEPIDPIIAADIRRSVPLTQRELDDEQNQRLGDPSPENTGGNNTPFWMRRLAVRGLRYAPAALGAAFVGAEVNNQLDFQKNMELSTYDRVGPLTGLDQAEAEKNRGLGQIKAVPFFGSGLAEIGNAITAIVTGGKISEQSVDTSIEEARRDAAQVDANAKYGQDAYRERFQTELSVRNAADPDAFERQRNTIAAGLQFSTNSNAQSQFNLEASQRGITNPMQQTDEWLKHVANLTQDAAAQTAMLDREKGYAVRDYELGQDVSGRNADLYGVRQSLLGDDINTGKATAGTERANALDAHAIQQVRDEAAKLGENQDDAEKKYRTEVQAKYDLNIATLDRQNSLFIQQTEDAAGTSRLMGEQNYRQAQINQLTTKYQEDLAANKNPEQQKAIQDKYTEDLKTLQTQQARQVEIIGSTLEAQGSSAFEQSQGATYFAQQLTLQNQLATNFKNADAADKDKVSKANDEILDAFQYGVQRQASIEAISSGHFGDSLENQLEHDPFEAQRDQAKAERANAYFEAQKFHDMTGDDGSDLEQQAKDRADRVFRLRDLQTNQSLHETLQDVDEQGNSQGLFNRANLNRNPYVRRGENDLARIESQFNRAELDASRQGDPRLRDSLQTLEQSKLQGELERLQIVPATGADLDPRTVLHSSAPDGNERAREIARITELLQSLTTAITNGSTVPLITSN